MAAGVAELTLEVAGGSGRTVIRVERGLLDRLPSLLREHAPAHAYALVSDSNVAPLYGEAARDALADAGLMASLHRFPAGEPHKTVESWGRLLEAFAREGLGRDGCVVAIGGGVTGDLAGFAASAYLRGVPVVQVPTSLLAMIDASIGGKTGVDLDAGKNLVGAFHHPRAVLIDPLALDTLPMEELTAGLAEAVKHGAIADRSYLDRLAAEAEAILDRDPDGLDRVVAESVRIKAGVVARDALEAGERAILNFGHTVAHGIEHASGFRVSHGRAVAMGMAAEARVGERMGITETGTAERLESVLRSVRLPVRIPGEVTAEAVLEAARSDKKARRGRTRYTLLARAGSPARTPDGRWTHEVQDADVGPVLEEVMAGPEEGAAV